METRKYQGIWLKYQSVILFVLGFGIFMFTRRSEFFSSWPFAIIIAPILILRFIRTLPAAKGIWYTFIGFLLSLNISLWGLFSFSDELTTISVSLIRSSLLAFLYFLPFMLDRLIYPTFKTKGIIATLTFPVTMTAVLFLSSLEGPFDGETAKTVYVYGTKYFKQLLAISGLWGFIFIYSWLASVINYIIEEKDNSASVIKSGSIFLGCFVIIHFYGFVQYSNSSINQNNKVKIAAANILPEDGKLIPMEQVFNKKTVSDIENTLNKIEALTMEAASKDMKIISFQEYAIVITESDVSRVQEEFSRISKENNIYLSICYAYYGSKSKGKNKHLLINNNGEILLDYTKRFLLGFGPYGETAVFNKGQEIIQSVNTPYGKIGIAICRDMNFSRYIKQASEQKVDIMIAPSFDFPTSYGPCYTHRAIEYGFSFVRPCYNGYSFASDYNGNVITSMPFDISGSDIMYAEVPTKRKSTVYSEIGDLFAWTCLVLLISMLVFNILKKGVLKSKYLS